MVRGQSHDCTAHFCREGLVEHLVGTQQDRMRHSEAKRLGGLEVDSHLQPVRKLNGKVRRLYAAENAIDVRRRATKYILGIFSVGNQTARLYLNDFCIHRWHGYRAARIRSASRCATQGSPAGWTQSAY